MENYSDDDPLIISNLSASESTPDVAVVDNASPQDNGEEDLAKSNGSVRTNGVTCCRGSMPPSKKLTICQVILLIFGTLGVVLGVAMIAGGFGMLLHRVLQSQLEIREGSTSYNIWKKTPFPLTMKLYLFNLTNSDDFLNGFKPVVSECGPYVYKEYHEKQNVTFHPNNTVTYFQQRWWIFDQEQSGNNTPNDIIYALNIVPVSATWAVRDTPLLLILNMMFGSVNESAVVKATAEELIFTGYEDPVLDWIQENVVAKNGTHHSWLKVLPKGLVNFKKFAWFYQRNMTVWYDGLFNMKTGADTLQDLGKIDWWNKTRATDYFSAPCNRVTGSAGELFPPHPQMDAIELYSSDLCMTLKVFYKENTTDEGGLQAYRYWGSNETFANGSVVPGNECYCVKKTCAPTGLLNAESCRMGAPAFVSFPHFLHADPFLLDAVDGLDPDEEKHQFHIDLLPDLGMPVNVAARMQINMHVIPYDGVLENVKILENVPDVYLPLLWFEVLAGPPPSMIWQLKALLFMMHSPAIPIIWGVVVATGVLIVAAVLAVALWRRHKENEMTEPLLQTDDEPISS